MSTGALPSLYSSHDFDLIESAVKETERGRWFLDEYARRNRQSNTDDVLAALTRLEMMVLRPDSHSARLLGEMQAIGKVIGELCRTGGEQPLPAQNTGAIATLAEQVQQTVWRLRTSGARGHDCTIIDKAAAELQAASARLDHAARREALVFDILRAVDGNIGAILAQSASVPMEDAVAPSAPAIMAEPPVHAAQAPEPTPLPVPLAPSPAPESAAIMAKAVPSAGAAPRPVTPQVDPAFAAIDGMPALERLRLFH